MYKDASKQGLRFNTQYGSLSVEQLWDVSVNDLDTLAVELEQEYKNSKGKSFIVKKTTKDKTIKLRFDIVLDVLTTKVEEADALRDAAGIKEHNQKILSLIASKQDESLSNLSIEELEKQLK